MRQVPPSTSGAHGQLAVCADHDGMVERRGMGSRLSQDKGLEDVQSNPWRRGREREGEKGGAMVSSVLNYEFGRGERRIRRGGG